METNKCLNPSCGKQLVNVPGRRKKKFCGSTCKSLVWYSGNKDKAKEYRKKRKLMKAGGVLKVPYAVATEKYYDGSNQLSSAQAQDNLSRNAIYQIKELEKELESIPDKTKGIGKALAQSIRHRIEKLKKLI